MSQTKKNIGILLGDPSGIGPELISKLMAQNELNAANIVIIGEKNIYQSGIDISKISTDLIYVEDFNEIDFEKNNKFFLDISKGNNKKYELSNCSEESGKSVLNSVPM